MAADYGDGGLPREEHVMGALEGTSSPCPTTTCPTPYPAALATAEGTHHLQPGGPEDALYGDVVLADTDRVRLVIRTVVVEDELMLVEHQLEVAPPTTPRRDNRAA